MWCAGHWRNSLALNLAKFDRGGKVMVFEVAAARRGLRAGVEE